MPIKFINPYFKSAVQLKAEQHAPAVQAWMQAQPTNKAITMNELRTGLPAIAADLTRPVVNHIMATLGAECENPEDDQA
jgi:hypothetical protein